MADNALDKVIGYFSPGSQLKRQIARTKVFLLKENLRKYEAASKGRRTDGWNSQGSSANTETRSALTILRDRSRQLGRDNPYAKRAFEVITTNTIGTGIRPTADKNSGKTAQKKIKKAWKDWAESTKCDHAGVFDFYGLQALIMKSVAESGECLVIKRRSRDLTVPLELQVVEADFLDHSHDGEQSADGNYTIQGIEFNRDGKRINYWLYYSHPGESGYLNSITSRKVPARDVLHIYRMERPGQVRGVPFGTSAMLRLKDFDDYEDAQLIRQKIAACFSIFVTDPDGDATAGTDAEKEELAKVEPGIIEYLKPGKEVTMASPPGVEQSYEPYSKTVLRAVAIAYGVTYESLTGDLSNVNFSSARMGWLEFHRLVNQYQSYMLVPMLCKPVWAWFMEALRVSMNLDETITAEWTTPRREMINPAEEIKAMSEAVRNGFMSWSEAIRQSGYDPEVVMQELREDLDLFDKNGFMFACDPRYDPNRKQPDATPGDNTDPAATEQKPTGEGAKT